MVRSRVAAMAWWAQSHHDSCESRRESDKARKWCGVDAIESLAQAVSDAAKLWDSSSET